MELKWILKLFSKGFLDLFKTDLDDAVSDNSNEFCLQEEYIKND
jgi:hypothetical protein